MYPKTKTKPWDHQIAGWNLAKDSPSFYYAVDMGGGKTKMAIDYCTGIDARLILVICPKKVIPIWYKQFHLHAGIPFNVWAHVKPKRTKRQKAELIQKAYELTTMTRERLVVVVNYDIFWQSPLGHTYNKDNLIVERGVLHQIPWDLIIFDEAHRLKTAGGRASWGAKRLGKSIPRRLMLSGTPMPSCPSDIYAQYRTLDETIFGTLKTSFVKRYMLMGGFEGRKVLGVVSNVEEEFNNKIYSIMYRVSKDDIFDLPDVLHQRLECELDPKGRRIYDQLESQLIAQIGSGEVTVSNALTKLLRLTQIAGGFATLDDGLGIQKIDNSKMDTLMEKIEDLGHNEPIIIFYRFKPEVAEMKRRLEKAKHTVSEVSGTMDQLEEWENGETQVACVQIQSGGEGIDLTRARYAFFYSKGMLSVGKHDQAIARLNRPGQTRKVIFYHLVAKNTIEVRVEYALKARKKLIDALLEDYQNNKPFSSRKAA
jgi:SNF2 family DNA or RNA helicase